jgi:putative peptidoglycan lipid II flippase
MTEPTPLSQQQKDTQPQKTVSETKRITRAAGVVGFWTALSRILGLVREMVTASFLGAGMSADAFFVAFRIPNLLRRLFAEGALSAAFIPTYVENLHRKGHDAAAQLARITLTFATIVLGLVTVAGIAFSPYIVKVFAPGFVDDSVKFGLTVSLNQIMFAYILFISLVALASGILNSMGHFGAPAAAPILLNVCMILSVVVFTTKFNVPAYYALAWAVLVSGVLQLLLQVPFLLAEDIKLFPDFNFRHPELRRVGALFVPAAIAGAVYQFNVFVGTVLASLLPAGGVSWLWYADRLVELPLGVFAIALGTAVLPSMSRQAAKGDMASLARSLSFALRFIAFFIIPSSVALIVLRVPITAVLFQRGLFTVTDTQQTAIALLYYTVGLWAFSGLKVVTQAFFSLKDTKTPLWISLIAVTTNLGFGLILMHPMKQGGLALATSIAAALNVGILFFILIRRLGWFPTREFTASIAKILVAAAPMGCFLYVLEPYGNWDLGLTKWNALVISGCIFGGLVIFFVSAFLLRCKELQSALNLLKKK